MNEIILGFLPGLAPGPLAATKAAFSLLDCACDLLVTAFQQQCNLAENCGSPVGLVSLVFSDGSSSCWPTMSFFMELSGAGSGVMACKEALVHLAKGDILSWRDAGCP